MNDKADSSLMWAIEVQGLTKSFGTYHALRDIDLKVKKGGHLVIFGPNGAGKTTMIKLLSTLSKPSAGEIRLDGIDVRDDPVQVRRKVSVVSHETFLYNNLTLYENLKFYGKMYDVPDLDCRISEVASQMQVESRLYDRVGKLSRGLQQRIAIARAVIQNPSIMLLDEPEVGLDPHGVIMMRDVLDILAHPDPTVVMTTHNLEQGLDMCDQVAILNKGKLVYEAFRHEIETDDFQRIYDHCVEMSR